MKKTKKINKLLAALVLGVLFTSCGVYDKYEPNVHVPSNVLGDKVLVASDTAMVRQLSWREFFTDPLLQRLIETALERNTDIHTAQIAVEQSEVSLHAAKQAILPSVSFSPSGTIANFNHMTSKTYNVPLQVSWDPGSIGSYTTKKRAAKARLLQAQVREEAVRANLISAVAQQYCLLQALDRQLEILYSTDSLWGKSLDAQKALWENGRVYSTAVNQLESSCINVKTQIVDTRRNIRSVENAICRLLAISPQHIERSPWGGFEIPQVFTDGVPARLLELRPDIRLANYAMEEAFYNMQTARSAFFPGFNLSGSVGWTNSAGGAELNPGKILTNIVGSIVQPIFARGQLKANLKLAQLTQQDLSNRYVQTVIDAGNQVNEALADCEAAREKFGYYQRQISVLDEAYVGTHELMDNGKANYLEVLTAQESLLSSQLSQAMNMYDAAQAVIELYIALGGAIY